jgi:hypothetical protein
MSTVVVCEDGSSERYFTNSTSSSRTVVRRPPASRPSRPSPRAMVTWDAPPRVLAASARVRAGTSTAVDMFGVSGSQESSRTASRNRSVAANVSVSPSISTRMPVSIGRVSSRPAATAVCATASANTAESTVPDELGICGSGG